MNDTAQRNVIEFNKVDDTLHTSGREVLQVGGVDTVLTRSGGDLSTVKQWGVTTMVRIAGRFSLRSQEYDPLPTPALGMGRVPGSWCNPYRGSLPLRVSGRSGTSARSKGASSGTGGQPTEPAPGEVAKLIPFLARSVSGEAKNNGKWCVPALCTPKLRGKGPFWERAPLLRTLGCTALVAPW